MSFRLVPLTPGTLPIIPLQRPILLVGRHSDCDVRINLSRISKIHCCLALAYDRVLIRDLGSRNGLRVNGRIVEESRLFPGDEVAIGPSLYRLDLEGVAQGRAATPPPSVRQGDGPANPASKPPQGSPDVELVPLDDD